MPDQPGKGPPSSAPLSLEDVDRLAENFTPFWEDAADTTERPSSAGAIPIVPPVPSDEDLAKLAAPKPAPRQTVPGIAPIYVGAAPSTAAPAPRVTAPDPLNVTLPLQARPTSAAHEALPRAALEVTQPLSTVTPLPEARASSAHRSLPHKQTLLGHLPPSVAPDAIDTEASPARERPSLPGYAIAYKPKDGPGTPAVVIAADALVEPPSVGTLQALGAPAAAHQAQTAVTVRAAAAGADDFDLYLRKKKTARMVWAAGAVVALLLLGLVAVRTLTGAESSRSTTLPSATSAAALPPKPPLAPPLAPAPVGSPPEADLPHEEIASGSPSPSAARPSAARPSAALPAIAPAKPVARRGAVRAPPAVVRSPATAPPATRERAAAAFPPEPSVPAAPAPPKTNSSKGVIVRESPF